MNLSRLKCWSARACANSCASVVVSDVKDEVLQQEKLLFVVIVEGGGLFGEQVDRRFAQIEILRNQAEHLERQLDRRGSLPASASS